MSIKFLYHTKSNHCAAKWPKSCALPYGAAVLISDRRSSESAPSAPSKSTMFNSGSEDVTHAFSDHNIGNACCQNISHTSDLSSHAGTQRNLSTTTFKGEVSLKFFYYNIHDLNGPSINDVKLLGGVGSSQAWRAMGIAWHRGDRRQKKEIFVWCHLWTTLKGLISVIF